MEIAMRAIPAHQELLFISIVLSVETAWTVLLVSDVTVALKMVQVRLTHGDMAPG